MLQPTFLILVTTLASCTANTPGKTKSLQTQEDIVVTEIRSLVRTNEQYSKVTDFEGTHCVSYYADSSFRSRTAKDFAQALRFKCSFRKSQASDPRECQIEFWSTPKGRYIFAMELTKGKERVLFKTRADKDIPNFSRRAISLWLNHHFGEVCHEIIESESAGSHGSHGSSSKEDQGSATADQFVTSLRKSIKSFQREALEFPTAP
jgi:hypothetical protein